MENKKKELRETLGFYTELSNIIDGTLDKVAKNFLDLEEKLKFKYPDKYDKFGVKLGNDYDDIQELEFFGIRNETDEEFKNRLKLNKRKLEANKKFKIILKEKQKKREYQTYLKLKKKFDKND